MKLLLRHAVLEDMQRETELVMRVEVIETKQILKIQLIVKEVIAGKQS